jgi:hypothetical protein
MVFTGWYDQPLLPKRACLVLQPHCYSGKETSMDNTIGNHPISASAMSKRFILRYKNPKDFHDH